ncbi:MAG: InlB B-repeat-containing protein [Paludibacteraceae bacterium]|nr:InlB B-repeat-containing protein [Paludibacteraceae bacterium]
MKTLHTINTNFAKRVLMALALITMGVSTAWGDTWTWTASNQNELGTSTSYSATLNDKTWSVKRSSVQHTGMTNDCIQLGKSGGAETVTLESSAFEGTINSVSVECASYNGAHKITISVGGTEYLSASTSSWQTVSSKKGEGDSSGQIQIKFTAGNGARALYIKSITVEYNAGGNQPDPEEPDEDLCGWVETDISKISSTDVVVITMNNGNTYAMSNDNGTSNPPSAVKVTVSDDKTLLETDDDKIADNIKWNVSNDNGTLTIYPNGTTVTWLYCTNRNNGVKVGTGSAKHFTIKNGYLYEDDTNDARYIGVYNSQDWRCYTSINSNIENQTLKFYRYVPCGPTETTITLYPNNGTPNENQEITTEEESYALPECPFSRTGYTFAGWATSADGSVVYEDKATIDDLNGTEVNLYAQWTPIQYKISYELDGGTNHASNPANYTIETQTITLQDPSKKGHTFKGWYRENTFANPITQITNGSTGDITLHAKWEVDTYTIILDANGGTFTKDGNTSKTIEIDYVYATYPTYDDAQLIVDYLSENNIILEKSGYNLKEMWLSSGSPWKRIYTETDNRTITAQWEEKQLTNFRTLCEYTVTWELAGGQIDSSTDDIVDTYTNGQEIQKPADPTREGYRFLGWSPDFVEGTKMQSQSLVYTAQWFELVVTQLQWSEDSYTATMEADNDFPDLTILPNDFAGELTYQSSDPAVATIAADGTITLIGTGTTTITASITADDTYLAASDSYELTVAAANCKWVETEIDDIQPEDEIVVTMTKNDGTTYALPHTGGASTAPAVISVTVSGISLSSDITDHIKWNVGNDEGNLTFYPKGTTEKWLYCTNTNNGVRVGVNTNNVFTIDATSGYLKHTGTSRYIGIYDKQDWRCYENTTNNIAGQTLKFYKRVCLDSEHYWVTWDANDGQFADGSTQIVKDYAVGIAINEPFDPTRAGYDFVGWSTDGVNVVTPAENMPNENLTYIAVWNIKSYTVTWDANGGQFDNSETIIEQTYEYGATITKPANPTRTGYRFTGWAPNVPTNMSTENLNFKAQWQVNQYTVTWDPGEGGHWGDSFAPIVENYNYGAPINRPANPEKAGYVFDKWEPDVVATMPNNNLIYTAKWNEAFCDAYTFHTGNANVWNDPQEQICFEFKANHEWQIINYVIPMSDAQSHFLVADKGWPQRDQGSLGGHSKSVTSTWSATMYLAPSMNSNDGNGSPKVGHAKGAVGTLRIFDDSNWDNLYVGFIPNGYKLKFGANEYDFEHYEDAEYRSEIVEYNATTANNNVSVGVINTNNAYVKTDHTQEGMRHIFLKVNSNWKSDEAKFAIYYFNSDSDNGWSKFMKEVPGETDMYEGWIPENYSKVIFVRLNPNGGINWDAKWNQTGNLTLKTDKTLYTIPSGTWDNAGDTNWSTYTRHGKFRIYNNSWDKNWYVHFYPHYVITFDKNAEDATGTMPPQALPLDANPKTIVLNECIFERRGYDFTGWETDVAITADGNSVAANGNVKDKATISNINKDITLKAQWKAQAYTITYKDQGDVAYSGENLASLPQTHTYDQTTTLVAGVKTGYTFGGWYLTPECDGTAVTELGAQDYTADITLYAKWTFAMEYNVTNTETIFITSAKGQTIKATTPLQLAVSNMPVGTKVAISAPNITFYDEAGNAITEVATKSNTEQFNLTIAYTPTVENTTEQPTITLSVLGNEKTFDGHISARSLPNTFAIVAKVGNMWYALPSQGLNSTTPPAAYPVEVDNMADPTAVTSVPANADWSLRQVYASSGSNDRFTANGDNLVFVNNASPAMTLNASSSEEKNYLLTDAQYANYYQTNPGLYEWTPTTTDLETYQLTNEQRSRTLSVNIATVFGVHAQDKAVEQVRFLPIQNRYTPAALQVVEWKENSVVIMYNGDPAQTASVSVNGAAAQNTKLSAAERDIAVYELAATGLAANPTQRLSITIGTEKVILSIPYIISGAQTDLALLPGSTVAARQEVAKVSDLVILKDATLTADGAKSNPYKFRNVTIYGGGKLVIPSEAKGFGVASLTLRAGGITDAGEYDYVYPQFELRGTFTNSAAKINYDYITDYDHWYHLVLPFAGDLTIKYPTEFYGANVAADNTGSWQIKRYAGEIRATGNYNAWVDIETEGETSTIAGQGYIFWGAPKKVSVNGGASTRQKWGIQRITMSVTAPNAMNAENADKAISELSSYENVPNNSGKDNDQGWNLIGNPYMVNLTDMVTTGLHACKLVEVIDPATGKWNGQWEWNDETDIRYLTIPSDHFDTYTAKTVEQSVPLVSGRAFFVQLEGEANGITFAAANRASLMPALRAANDKPVDIETGIVLSNETLQDEVNFWIKDGKTNDYEYNADYPKTPNNNQFNIYGVHTNGDLSWVATGPEYAAESMPIGYQVPAAGTYMLSLSEIYNSDGLDALYVTDHALSPEVTVDIMSEPYEFSVNQAETNNERFTVSVRVKAKTENGATGLGNVGADGEQIHKFIYQDKMYILHHGVIYDATGKRVITINK